MAASHSTPQPSPVLFFDTMRAYQRTAALKSAIELDLFTAIGEGNATAQAAARRCQASQRGTRILCDFLVVIGFLTKENDRYSLTPDSAAFLDRRSTGYLGGATEFLSCPSAAESFGRLTEAVRKGRTAVSESGATVPENPDWVKFARGMAGLARISSELTAGRILADTMQSHGTVRRVLDIAAGHGLYGISVARRFPDATITAVDWPNVLSVAKENAQAAGIGERYRMIPGSAFDVEFGKGYDIALLSNILHHFDPPTCERLLLRVHAALKNAGRAFTVDFVPNEDRVSPREAALFSLTMLANTPAGEAYTFSELDRMFRNAGFHSSELLAIPPSISQLVISRK